MKLGILNAKMPPLGDTDPHYVRPSACEFPPAGAGPVHVTGRLSFQRGRPIDSFSTETSGCISDLGFSVQEGCHAPEWWIQCPFVREWGDHELKRSQVTDIRKYRPLLYWDALQKHNFKNLFQKGVYPGNKQGIVSRQRRGEETVGGNHIFFRAHRQKLAD